jgi:hypothetical protein
MRNTGNPSPNPLSFLKNLVELNSAAAATRARFLSVIAQLMTSSVVMRSRASAIEQRRAQWCHITTGGTGLWRCRSPHRIRCAVMPRTGPSSGPMVTPWRSGGGIANADCSAIPCAQGRCRATMHITLGHEVAAQKHINGDGTYATGFGNDMGRPQDPHQEIPTGYITWFTTLGLGFGNNLGDLFFYSIWFKENRTGFKGLTWFDLILPLLCSIQNHLMTQCT